MQRFKIGVAALMCFLMLVTVLTALPSIGAQAQGQGQGQGAQPANVNVVNTPTVNAQQSGDWNVAVAGTPTVSAQQSGAWNVGLSGTPTVNAQQTGPWDVGVPGVTNRVTTSARAVILAGQISTNVSLAAPSCPAGTSFLVTDFHAGPEVLIGATSTNVVELDRWAISVAVYQFSGGGASQVALTALGNGPEAISASIPAGQQILGSSVPATIVILGGGTAPQRFEFNVHVTGFCGVGFTL